MVTTAQINDPVILARTGRYSDAPEEGTPLPMVYGDLTDGVAGIWNLPKIDDGGEVYCFASHPVQTVADGNIVTIHDDTGIVPGANYTFDHEIDFGGRGKIAAVTFSTAPSGVVSAQGKGKVDAGGLIENPITLIENLFKNVIKLSDETSQIFSIGPFNVARSRASQMSYKAAGVIQDDFTPGGILQEILKSFFGQWHMRTDRLISIFIDSDPDEIPLMTFGDSVDGYIHQSEIDRAVLSGRRRDEIVNTPSSFYRFNYASSVFFGFEDGQARRNLKSVSIHGELSRREGPFEFFWNREAATVRKVQGALVNQFGNGPRIFEVDHASPRLINAEFGDFLALNLDFINDEDGNALRNQICRVLFKSYVPPSNMITFRLLDMGAPLTIGYLADGSVDADGSKLAGSERDKARRG